MSRHGIVCRSCGAQNEIVALSCEACGEALVSESDTRFHEAQATAARAEERAHASAIQLARVRRAAIAGLVAVVVGVLLWLSYDLATRNLYLGGEPTYAGESAEQWLERLGDEDHFVRRRAALALATLAASLNEKTARNVVDPLSEALADEDEVVRERVAEALATIQERTGVSARK